jgi:peroxiredoxin/uncharacterized membrane protein YphA (DoxX/SURF4 family)
MEVALLLARLFLALVFGVAGISKIADPAGSRQALLDFGAPERFAPALARALPVAEMLAALALIPLAAAWWGGIAALTLLLIFTAGIGANLARGQAPDCRCFGQLHSEPVSWTTFARNLALAAAAGFIVVEGRSNPGLSAFSWLNELRTAEVINLTLAISVIGMVIALSVFLNRILKQQAKLLRAVETIKAALNEDGELEIVEQKEAPLPAEGLPVGAMAPKFSLNTMAGERESLDDLLGYGKAVLLLFVGPNCWGCKVLLPMVKAWQRDYGDRLTIAALSAGGFKDNQAKMTKYEIERLLLDEGAKVADEYQAIWTPAAVLIHPDGRIALQNTYGDNAIREAIRDIIASDQLQTISPTGNGATRHAPQVSTRYSVGKIGDPAPRFSLQDMSGNTVNAEDLLGSPTLLLFWHPLCEFCKAMSADIRRWENNRTESSPKLVFIASGDAPEIRAANKDFKSLTLLDPAFEFGPLFGTKFTPSAILIDGNGRIASSLAMGDPNVRALIGLRKSALPVLVRV